MKEETIGLKTLEECILKCSNCNRKLISIELIENNERRTSRGLPPQKIKYQVVGCDKCGAASFLSKVFEGTTICGPINNKFDMYNIDEDDNGVIFVTLKIL